MVYRCWFFSLQGGQGSERGGARLGGGAGFENGKACAPRRAMRCGDERGKWRRCAQILGLPLSWLDRRDDISMLALGLHVKDKHVAEDVLGAAEDGSVKVFIVARVIFQPRNPRPTRRRTCWAPWRTGA